MDEDDKKARLLILIFTTIVIVITIIVTTIKTKKNNNKIDNSINTANNSITNTLNDNTAISNTNTSNTQNEETVNEENNVQNEEENSKKEVLKRNTERYVYFLVKYCMKKYNGELNKFCIDEIYKQKITSEEDAYLVYFRIGQNNSSIKNSSILVKINNNENKFLIYPNEFLEEHNIINLKQNDSLNSDELKEKCIDTYNKDEINTKSSAYMKELFERYKFDLEFDTEHLYNIIDDTYKQRRFGTFENFNQYLNINKEQLIQEKYTKYMVKEYKNYRQYTAICDNTRHYIFNIKNLMNYKIMLDNYTVASTQYIESYNNSIPKGQVKFCINRVKNAINDKNYEFVYNHLNPIQKSNFYQNYIDFENFIKPRFYEKCDFEFEDYYTIVEDEIYQYRVKVTDSTKKEKTFRRFDMCVTLKKGTDFEIAITTAES